jgi:hypothetical protein
MRSTTTSGQELLKEPTTGFAPACFRLQGGRLSRFEPRRQFKHEREDSNPIGQFWRLPALPGARSHMPTSWGLGGGRHSSSSTFQYASLTNLDQLSIRIPWEAVAARRLFHPHELPS